MLSKYIIFAIIATITNIAVQAICFNFYKGPFSLQVAIIFGTASGLVLKYLLDKKFVFSHSTENLKAEGQTFTLYTLMGVFTTIIFWGIEWLFYLFLQFDWAKYLGAIIGLSIGYIIKFYLDKKFVFN